MNHKFSVTVTHSPRNTPAPAAPASATGLSLVNLAARQRMLSQRMVLQTVLAAQGHVSQLEAARKSLQVFAESQQHLEATPRHLETSAARRIETAYRGPQGAAPLIADFIELARTTLDQIERHALHQNDTLETLVERTEQVLTALNAATTAFDEVTKAKSDAMMHELSGIVGDIQSVAKEAKVVSFNAQVMAARAGQHGREFAVVANVLSTITSEIDGLTRKAMLLADRSRYAA